MPKNTKTITENGRRSALILLKMLAQWFITGSAQMYSTQRCWRQGVSIDFNKPTIIQWFHSNHHSIRRLLWNNQNICDTKTAHYGKQLNDGKTNEKFNWAFPRCKSKTKTFANHFVVWKREFILMSRAICRCFACGWRVSSVHYASYIWGITKMLNHGILLCTMSTECWMPSAEYQTLNDGCWILNAEWWMLNIQRWISNTEHQTLSTKCWMSNAEYQMLNAEYDFPRKCNEKNFTHMSLNESSFSEKIKTII